MGAFDLANPTFRLYVIAAAIMTLKLMAGTGPPSRR